jgi:hypothetical protein
MADAKITALNTASVVTSTDVAALVVNMAITPETRQITAANLLSGWIESPLTWSYASASTFTVSGDQTAVYTKGKRIRWTQTTVKYGVVLSASYGAPNTTVTIAVNTDYVITNAPISSAAYALKYSTPYGFPDEFNFTPAWTNLTVGNGTQVARYSIVAGRLFCYVNLTFGASSSISGSVSLAPPVAMLSTYPGSRSAIGMAAFLDTGTALYNGSCVTSTTATIEPRAINAAGTYGVFTLLSSTIPHTWAATDELNMTFNYPI